MNENIYNMKLHTSIIIEIDDELELEIIRVPGGWIYYDNGLGVFVPFNDEFDSELLQKIKEGEK